MPTYDSITDRTDAGALIRTKYYPEIFKGAVENSNVMRMARRLANMSAKTTSISVLNALPVAYFVNGDTGLKQTSEAAWKGVNLVAEEVAVIVPIPEAVLDDADYDIWAEINGPLKEAFGLAIDAAVLFGTNKPASWPAALVAGAAAAGNVVQEGSGLSRYQELLGEGGLLSKVEEDGYVPNGHIGAISLRAKLRGQVDGEGRPLFSGGTFDGIPISYPENGSWDASQALMITGDWRQLVYSIRQDLTFKVLRESVIQDGDGNIVYNLAQQDMVALRAVMRVAFALPNPVNRLQPNEANRYPFAVYTPAD